MQKTKLLESIREPHRDNPVQRVPFRYSICARKLPTVRENSNPKVLKGALSKGHTEPKIFLDSNSQTKMEHCVEYSGSFHLINGG